MEIGKYKYYLKLKYVQGNSISYIKTRSNDYVKFWYDLQSIGKTGEIRILYMNVIDDKSNTQILNFTSKNPPPPPTPLINK